MLHNTFHDKLRVSVFLCTALDWRHRCFLPACMSRQMGLLLSFCTLPGRVQLFPEASDRSVSCTGLRVEIHALLPSLWDPAVSQIVPSIIEVLYACPRPSPLASRHTCRAAHLQLADSCHLPSCGACMCQKQYINAVPHVSQHDVICLRSSTQDGTCSCTGNTLPNAASGRPLTHD